MEFEVIVQPKKEVLDPEGRAIQETLSRVGFACLQEVKVSKRYILRMHAGSELDAEEVATRIAGCHLANPVAETFHLKRL